MKADRQARTILLNATIHATLVDATLAHLDLGLAGWPTSTPGASPPEPQPPAPCRDPDCTNNRPCPDHDDVDQAETFGPVATEYGHVPVTQLTSTERFASQPDQARRDLETYIESSKIASRHLAILARIDQRWAYTGVNASSVKERLYQIDADIWCEHCSQFGEKNPREEGKPECDYCGDFRQKRGRKPPREIFEARKARNGRLDETTIVRILQQVDDDRKAKRAAEKKAQRDAQRDTPAQAS